MAAPRDSNPDMLIQSPFTGSENNENPAPSSAESGKVRSATETQLEGRATVTFLTAMRPCSCKRKKAQWRLGLGGYECRLALSAQFYTQGDEMQQKVFWRLRAVSHSKVIEAFQSRKRGPQPGLPTKSLRSEASLSERNSTSERDRTMITPACG